MKRSLGLLDVTLFIVIAGTNLQWVATAGNAGAQSIAVWLIGAAVLFVPLIVAVAFLSSVYPEEGGIYVWAREVFGPFWGFLCGWLYWASNLPYLPVLLYFTIGNALYAIYGSAGAHASPSVFIFWSLAGLALGTVVNIFGLDSAKWLNNIGSISRWLATIVLVVLGIVSFARFGSATGFSAHALVPGLSLTDMLFWITIAFAYAGPESVACLCGEIREPRRSVPLGLAAGAPLIVLLYIAGTVAILVAMPPNSVDKMYGVMQTIDSAAARVGVPMLTKIAGILVTVSCLGSVGAWVCSTARLPFAAGLDAYLPRAFGRMHPRYGSPVVALVVQSVITAIIAVLGQSGTSVRGAYDVLIGMGVIATYLPYLFLFGAVLFTRVAFPADLAIPGGRRTVVAAGIIGLMTTAATIVLSTLPSADETNKPLAVFKVIGLAFVLVGAGVALYYNGARNRARRLSTAEV
ncbi:MAG TPA: APC family permease [Candidatus Aquilonibacter sp.]|nr:APC family permease [Candidatus Aquilonibacter sp.]